MPESPLQRDEWLLKRGDETLARIVVHGIDQPWFLGRFEPLGEFATSCGAARGQEKWPAHPARMQPGIRPRCDLPSTRPWLSVQPHAQHEHSGSDRSHMILRAG
jgi:hypothetical protein